jgi:IS66 C-terminal element
MNEVDPQAWLADVLAPIAEHPAHLIDLLLPKRGLGWQVSNLCGSNHFGAGRYCSRSSEVTK